MKNITLILGILVVLAGGGLLFFNTEIFEAQRRAEIMLRKGKLLIEQETPESVKKAMAEFTDVIAEFPNSQYAREARYNIAQAYEKLGLRDLALKKYRALVKERLTPEQARLVKFKIAKLDILRDYSEEGVTSLLNLLTQTDDPNLRSEIYFELGRFYHKEKNLTKAEKNLRIALTENPRNRDALRELASVYKDAGKTDESFQVYERYLSLAGDVDTDKPEVRNQYRKTLLANAISATTRKEYGNAKILFHKLIRKFPDTAEAEEARYYLGNIAFEEGQFTEAIRNFNAVIEKAPDIKDAQAYLKKGEALYKMKEYPRAAAVFAFVKKHYPGTSYAKLAEEWDQEVQNAINEASGLSVEEQETPPKKEEPKPKDDTDPLIEEPHLEDGETLTP